jgi:tRNA G37 N-methylase TrmD
MKFDILTLFPEMFEVFNYSIIKRAIEDGIIDKRMSYDEYLDFKGEQ